MTEVEVPVIVGSTLDVTLIVVAIISAIGGVCAAAVNVVTLFATRGTHRLINSRMTTLVKLEVDKAFAEGVDAERERAEAESDA